MKMRKNVFVGLGIAVVGFVCFQLVRGYIIVETIPGYTFKDGHIKIHNCDGERDENAESMCPTLYCWKKIYEEGGLNGKFKPEAVEDRYFGGRNKPYILSGVINYAEPQPDGTPEHYRCVMDGDSVLSVDILSTNQWKALTETGQFWRI